MKGKTNMSVDKETLKKITSLDDQNFKKLVSEIAAAAGADPKKTAMLLQDSGRLKEMLGDMTPDEANQLLNKVGKDRAEGILNNIKNKI